MNQKLSLTEQLDFLTNITCMMLELVQTAEYLGIETYGKTRDELAREIHLAEHDTAVGVQH